MKLLRYLVFSFFYSICAVEQDTIDWLNKKKLAISLGGNCVVAGQLKNATLRYCTFPFDWCLSTAKGVIKCLQEDFENFLQIKNLIPDDKILIINKCYDISFVHDFPFQEIRDFTFKDLKKYYRFENRQQLIESQYTEIYGKLFRRIERFRQLKQYKGELYFIRCFITQIEAVELLNTLQSYFSQQNLRLIAINDTNEFKIDWHIPGIQNFFKSDITAKMFQKGFFADIFKKIGLIES